MRGHYLLMTHRCHYLIVLLLHSQQRINSLHSISTILSIIQYIQCNLSLLFLHICRKINISTMNQAHKILTHTYIYIYIIYIYIYNGNKQHSSLPIQCNKQPDTIIISRFLEKRTEIIIIMIQLQV